MFLGALGEKKQLDSPLKYSQKTVDVSDENEWCHLSNHLIPVVGGCTCTCMIACALYKCVY